MKKECRKKKKREDKPKRFVVHTLSITRRSLMVKTNSESDRIPRREIDSMDDETEENLKFENLKGGTALRIDRVGSRINLGERWENEGRSSP